MRFLLDQNLPPLVAAILQGAGHDALHARDLGLSHADDEVILAAAAADARILVSNDTDFGEMLARTNLASPSLLLIRRQGRRRAVDLAALLLANLDTVASDLAAGAVVVFDGDRLRVRRLPFVPDPALEDSEGRAT